MTLARFCPHGGLTGTGTENVLKYTNCFFLYGCFYIRVFILKWKTVKKQDIHSTIEVV